MPKRWLDMNLRHMVVHVAQDSSFNIHLPSLHSNGIALPVDRPQHQMERADRNLPATWLAAQALFISDSFDSLTIQNHRVAQFVESVQIRPELLFNILAVARAAERFDVIVPEAFHQIAKHQEINIP